MDIITEDYRLPSLGKLYTKKFDPDIKLRSMTVADEMKRLSPTNKPYKQMSEIIDSCIVGKLPISSYDMCIGDYTYLLHKLRVVTYGPDYSISFKCPNCGKEIKTSVNLDALGVKYYEDNSLSELVNITLPKSGNEVKLKFQTPRDMDIIEAKVKEDKLKFPDAPDQRLVYIIQSYIDTIDGEPLDPVMGREMLKNLPLADMNAIVKGAYALSGKVGIDDNVSLECDSCGHVVTTSFPYTGEFFRP